MSGTMRCDDAIRALAVPTADHDASALAEHLAACPACALEAHRGAQFDRLWNATRPTEPTTDTWDALWAKLSARLDQPAADLDHQLLALPATADRRWRRWRWGMPAVAAALLVGFSLLFSEPHHEAAAKLVLVDIKPGQTVVIRGTGQVEQIVGTSADSTSNSLDDSFTMFNALEAMAD